MKTPKLAFHCSDCSRDFKTKAALIAHENLSAAHSSPPPKRRKRPGELVGATISPTQRLINPEAVRKLRDGGMPWREIAKRLGGVSLGGVRHAYGADKRSNHHARKENALSVKFIGAHNEDVYRGILTSLQSTLRMEIAELVAKEQAVDEALKAFPPPKEYR